MSGTIVSIPSDQTQHSASFYCLRYATLWNSIRCRRGAIFGVSTNGGRAVAGGQHHEKQIAAGQYEADAHPDIAGNDAA
jgi:hypothetical protein